MRLSVRPSKRTAILFLMCWPTATALLPFVPSGKDFAVALAFVGELGFETTWKNEGLAGPRFGNAAFLLQHIDALQWAGNQMLVLEVDDLAIGARSTPRVCPRALPACARESRRTIRGAARSTSSIRRACAGT